MKILPIQLQEDSSVENRLWETYENLTWEHLCQIICRLWLVWPPAAEGGKSKMQHSCFS
jgi:hypothetical protein